MSSSWIQTYTGVKFFPLDPNPQDVKIEDIAHALSNVCRFAGQCHSHYSVALHSVCVSKLLEEVYGSDKVELCLLGLLHDAPEAYFGDIPRPVKHNVPGFKEIEEALMDVIEKALMPGIDTEPLWPLVVYADNANLATEGTALFQGVTENWTDNILARVPENVRMSPQKIRLTQPNDAKLLFTSRFFILKNRLNG